MRWSIVILLVACGDQIDPPCAIPCGDGCPSGLTCSVGFCAADGETCDPDLQQLSAGAGYACGVDQFGRAWCGGDNQHRQIADTDRRVFERATVAGARRWDAIAAGGGHTCALDGGELWCWGRNDRNQVTSGIVGDVPAPVRIEVDGATVEWTKVATGFDYTCGIANGRLFCWGAGDSGKLGSGSPNDIPRPQIIQSTIDDWIDLDAGLRHTCAISRSTGVWCWGDGSSGQLGNARFNVKLEPQAAGLVGATRIAVGLDSTCAIADGTLYCWGRATQGALGDPDLVDPDGENQATPVQASLLGGWIDIAAAQRHACGLREDGSVYCWGTARAGGLGRGLWNHQRGFGKVLDGATALTVGWNGTDSDPGRDEADLDLACATAAGRVHCWGDNRAGQLAQGAATRSETPVEVAGDREWLALAAGASHVCGIAGDDRAVYCWGSVELGQVAGRAAGRTNVCTAELCDVAIPEAAEIAGADELVAGANHTCARSASGLACWGDSRLGQAGSQAVGAIAPAAIAGSWSAVFAGGNGTCGIDDGEVACWGNALESHPPEPDPELAGATSIGLGFDLGCLLDAAGELACFGDPSNGAFGNGDAGTCGDGTCNGDETGASCAADCGEPPLTRLGRSYDAIAIGRRAFGCGLRADGVVECWGDNTEGQVGSFELSIATVPNKIEAAIGCSSISAGRGHACAICGDDIVCWGDARHGEVGAPASATPAFGGRVIEPPNNDRWTTVTAGDGFTCATTASKRALCWGTSLHGALGNGGRGANLPIAIQLEGAD